MCLDLIIAMDYGMLPCEVSSKHTKPPISNCLLKSVYLLPATLKYQPWLKS